jgi:hypothetical protein
MLRRKNRVSRVKLEMRSNSISRGGDKKQQTYRDVVNMERGSKKLLNNFFLEHKQRDEYIYVTFSQRLALYTTMERLLFKRRIVA